MVKRILAHPATRGLDIDDPRTTEQRQRILRDKAFLRKVYEEWYSAAVCCLPVGDGAVLELGSGAGFLADFIPGLVTSDVFYSPGVRAVLDARELPFVDNSLRAIVMTDVLHHLPQPRRFFSEAARCLRYGGSIIMIEPWVTHWSRVVYRRLHHEPFQPQSPEWEFPESGPLSGANLALPWILFSRDRTHFERDFPTLAIQLVKPIMPFRYLASGGISARSFMPGWSYGLWRGIEHMLSPVMGGVAMFSLIVLNRME